MESAISRNAKPAYFEIENKYLPKRQILSDCLVENEQYEQEKQKQTKELFQGIFGGQRALKKCS